MILFLFFVFPALRENVFLLYVHHYFTYQPKTIAYFVSLFLIFKISAYLILFYFKFLWPLISG